MANPMQDIKLFKVVLDIGIGSHEQQYDNAKSLLKKLTGMEATQATAKKRDPSLDLKKGQIIGAVVTLRNSAAEEILKKALDAKDNKLSERCINDNTLSFGIKEYIDFAGVKYDPKIGMLGMHVNASFNRKGARVAARKRTRSAIGAAHKKVAKAEIIEYLKAKFNTNVMSN